MNDYKKAVVDFSNNKKDFQFTNKGEQHAAIVVANLIRTTDDELRIYSGKLNRDVANDSYLVKMLNLFLESGKTLYLILDEMPDSDGMSQSLKQIIASKNNHLRNVKIKIDTNNIFKEKLATIFMDNQPHHFMLGDNLSYRLEVDAEQYKAVCNFNDTEIVASLKKQFDDFFLER